MHPFGRMAAIALASNWLSTRSSRVCTGERSNSSCNSPSRCSWPARADRMSARHAPPLQVVWIFAYHRTVPSEDQGHARGYAVRPMSQLAMAEPIRQANLPASSERPEGRLCL